MEKLKGKLRELGITYADIGRRAKERETTVAQYLSRRPMPAETTQTQSLTTVARPKPLRHRLQTRSVVNIVRRAAQLELLLADTLPTGIVHVTVECDFGLGPRGDAEMPLHPHTIAEHLTNLSNRCRLVLLCDDRQGYDIRLVPPDVDL